MSDIQIESKFKILLPPLSEEQKEELEKDILKNGCLNPLIFWNNILIDGHHRYEICTRNNIPLDIMEMEFETELEAMEWAWSNQKNRRNLSNYELAQAVLKFKPEIEERARERTVAGKTIDPMQSSSQGSTREELAKLAGVSHDTISKVEVIENQADEEIKRQVQLGQITINNAYNLTKSAIEAKKRNEELEKEYEDYLQKEKIERREKDIQEEFEKSLPENAVVLNKFRKSNIFGITDFDNLTNEQFDNCLKHTKKYQEIISKVAILNVEEDSLKAWNCITDSKEMIDIELKDISIAINKLITIQNYFKGVKK